MNVPVGGIAAAYVRSRHRGSDASDMGAVAPSAGAAAFAAPGFARVGPASDAGAPLAWTCWRDDAGIHGTGDGSGPDVCDGSASGIGSEPGSGAGPCGMLRSDRATLVMELWLEPAPGPEQVLLRAGSPAPGQKFAGPHSHGRHFPGAQAQVRQVSVRITADRVLRIDRRCGEVVSALALPLAGLSGPVLVCHTVDARRGRSLLSAESMTDGQVRQSAGFDPIPFETDEMTALLAFSRRPPTPETVGMVVGATGGFAGSRAGSAAVSMIWAGVAKGRMPSGPRPGLHGRTRIDTPDGPCRIDRIRAGDRVQMADGGTATVCRSATLRLPAAGSFRPVRLRAPYFGRGHDLITAPDQLVRLTGADIEYLLGCDAVLAEARQLVDGRTAIVEQGTGTVAYHGLVLDRPGLIVADGCVLEGMAGTMSGRHATHGDAPPLAVSSGSDVPQSECRHRLHGYETTALAALRAARRSQAPV